VLTADCEFGQVIRSLPGRLLVVILDAAIDVHHFRKAEDRLKSMQQQRIPTGALIRRTPYRASTEEVHVGAFPAVLAYVLRRRPGRIRQNIAPDRNWEVRLIACRGAQ
jgi:hypothetical protein